MDSLLVHRAVFWHGRILILVAGCNTLMQTSRWSPGCLAAVFQTFPRLAIMKLQSTITSLLLLAQPLVFVVAQQAITLNDVAEGLPAITADEAMAGHFSAAKAAEYL